MDNRETQQKLADWYVDNCVQCRWYLAEDRCGTASRGGRCHLDGMPAFQLGTKTVRRNDLFWPSDWRHYEVLGDSLPVTSQRSYVRPAAVGDMFGFKESWFDKLPDQIRAFMKGNQR